jgi:monomeric isocitrate dehydrogenase
VKEILIVEHLAVKNFAKAHPHSDGAGLLIQNKSRSNENGDFYGSESITIADATDVKLNSWEKMVIPLF